MVENTQNQIKFLHTDKEIYTSLSLIFDDDLCSISSGFNPGNIFLLCTEIIKLDADSCRKGLSNLFVDVSQDIYSFANPVSEKENRRGLALYVSYLVAEYFIMRRNIIDNRHSENFLISCEVLGLTNIITERVILVQNRNDAAVETLVTLISEIKDYAGEYKEKLINRRKYESIRNNRLMKTEKYNKFYSKVGTMIYIQDELYDNTLNNIFKNYAFDVDAALAIIFDEYKMESSDKKQYDLFYPRSVFSFCFDLVNDNKYLDTESKNKLLKHLYDNINKEYLTFKPLIKRNPMRQCAAILSRLFAEFFVIYFHNQIDAEKNENKTYDSLLSFALLAKCRFEIISDKRFKLHQIISELIADINSYGESKNRENGSDST